MYISSMGIGNFGSRGSLPRTERYLSRPELLKRPCDRSWYSSSSPRMGARFFVVLTFLAMLATPAVAKCEIKCDGSTASCQEEQVSCYFAPIVQRQSTDHAWYWESVVSSCTRTLMRGSPEQNPDEGRVRFTRDAQLFLLNCAEQKGFIGFPADGKPKP